MTPIDEKTAQAGRYAQEGSRFGHYYLESRLAQGGMADVFLGRDTELDEDAPLCVIKCILPSLADNANFLAMFVNEAQLAAQMDHPNIVKVLDFGEFEGLLYMAMEYVNGMDCWRFARRGMPMGEARTRMAIHIVCRVLDALEYAHDMTDVNGKPLGVVHRDLSPSNIYLGRRGEVKLGDFGIADIKSSRYREISFIPQGKFGYVSPEQLEGETLDRRSDIFSMGIVLSELLLGKKIFKAASQLSVMLEIREGRFETIEHHKDQIDPVLLDIVYRALAVNRDDRFQTANEFRMHLDQLLPDGVPIEEELAENVARAADNMSMTSLVSKAAQPPVEVKQSQSQEPTDPTAMSKFLSEDYEELYGDMDETPVTLDLANKDGEWAYTVKLPNHRVVGPFTFAHVMELIYRSEITNETLVSLNGNPFVPAESLPELNRHIPTHTKTLEVEEEKAVPDKRGVFAIEAPGEIVLGLALGTETGMLVCKRESHRKEVYFQSGKPVYVSSNDPKELLGEYLVTKGVIDRAELEMALEVLPKFAGHMGDTLIALGMVSALDLFRSLGEQMKDRFTDLLTWRRGSYEFYRNVQCRQDVPEIPIDSFAFVTGVLLKASESLDPNVILGEMKRSLIGRTPRTRALLDRLAMPRSINMFFDNLVDTVSVEELRLTLSPSQSKKTLVSAIFVGLETGVWMVEGPTPPWRE